jgi:predicted transposase YbfD/YdcC
MKNYPTKLKREEIFGLARLAKLLLVDGDIVFLNDMATETNIIDFARLIESKQVADRGLSKIV